MLTTKGLHQYLDDGVPIPSVTTILRAYPKELVGWASRLTAGYAVDHWDDLSAMRPSQRLAVLSGVTNKRRDAAALSGRAIHALGEQVVAGAEVEVDPEHRGSVEAYARWLDEWDIQPIVVERPIINRTVGYAGRPDLLATAGRAGTRWLFDLKTGSVVDSQALQLTGYAHAERYLTPDGAEADWPTPDRCAIVHVQGDAVEVLPATVDEFSWRTFRHLAEVWQWWDEASRAYKSGDPWPIGEPLRAAS